MYIGFSSVERFQLSYKRFWQNSVTFCHRVWMTAIWSFFIQFGWMFNSVLCGVQFPYMLSYFRIWKCKKCYSYWAFVQICWNVVDITFEWWWWIKVVQEKIFRHHVRAQNGPSVEFSVMMKCRPQIICNNLENLFFKFFSIHDQFAFWCEYFQMNSNLTFPSFWKTVPTAWELIQ